MLKKWNVNPNRTIITGEAAVFMVCAVWMLVHVDILQDLTSVICMTEDLEEQFLVRKTWYLKKLGKNQRQAKLR